jgi:hypothetical protein
MPDAQLTNRLSPRDIVRPRCPMCYAHMETVRVVPGLHGLEHRTLRCPKCRLIYEARASADPIDSDALRWIDSELRPPQ